MRWLTEPLETPRLVVRGVSGAGLRALILIGLASASCGGKKEANTNEGNTAPEVDPCDELIQSEPLYTFRTSGDTPHLAATDSKHCEPGVFCYDSYILPSTIQPGSITHQPRLWTDDLLFISADGTTITSEVVRLQHHYYGLNVEHQYDTQVWNPVEPLMPSTQYEVWRQYVDTREGEPDLCFDFSLMTTSHGSPTTLPSTPLPVMQINVKNFFYIFDYSQYWYDLVLGGTSGGPNFAIQIEQVVNGQASVRVAAVNDSEQSWCRATLEAVIAVDENGAFQIPGVPWRGSDAVDDSFGGDFKNLLAQPFTISGHLAPDGQNAILTFDNVLLDGRLTSAGCEWGLPAFDAECPDGETCCMDASTGPTITEPSPLTSLEHIAQDNCHARCPTSADNPDCTLP